MKKLLLIISIALSLSTSAAGQRLVILHTNDTHSQIEELRTGRNKGRGGVERRLQFIDSVRSQYGADKVLLLDAGDYNQGTPYFTMAKGDLEVELMNILGYDATTIGNHEFDNGQAELARRINNSAFPTVCCNMDFTGTPLEECVKPYIIIKRGGLKVGIIGATVKLGTLVFADFINGITELNTIETVNKYADYLRNKKKCDIVVLLSHLGYSNGGINNPSDTIMAANSENIDIIIGGHSHTYMDKPDEVSNKSGKRVIVVQAGDKGVEVGVLKIY